MLRPSATEAVCRHIRRRLDRWEIPVPPGRRARRLETALQRLGRLVPPCVWSAVLKTALDGWTCADANLRAPRCCFGCKMACDSLRHYANCPVIARLARTRLRLVLPPFEERFGDFMLLTGSSDTSLLALRALRLYATFMATNASRHGRVAIAGDAWIQAVTDVASRDFPLKRIYNTLWNSPGPSA